MGTSIEAMVAGEVRHRISLPNSRRRAIKLVGVGEGGARVVRATASLALQDVSAAADPGNAADMAALLESFAGADMIVAVACAGDDPGRAQLIGQAARLAGVMVTGVFIEQDGAGAVRADLAILRASCDMLVIASEPDYVADMLVELGA